jgi:hypothetical protein
MPDNKHIPESVRLMEKMADILNDEANAEIEQLRKERDDLYEARLASMLYITALRIALDEARRKICEMEAERIVHPPCSPQQYAVRMGWDCFPDKTEADANNTLFRTTDGE